MNKHRSTGKTRSSSRKRRAISPSKWLYRARNVEWLEDRIAPAVQVFSGLEFMTTGTFSVNNNVVTSSSPVEVGVTPASSGTFEPLLLLQSGVQFNSTDMTGTFTTPPSGGSAGAVSAFADGTTVPLLNAQAYTFEAPALLSTTTYDTLSPSSNTAANLGVAGGDLSVTALRFNGSSELDVQGSLSFANFAGLALGVSGSDYVALNSSGVSLTGLSVTLPGPTSFTEAGLDFTATNLQVTYSPSNSEFDLSGSATLTAAGNTFYVTLGSTSTPGMVIENGSLYSLDATVSGSFAYGDLTVTAQDLTIQASKSSNLTITGTASVDFSVAGNSETLGLELGTTESGVTAPGLVINQSTGDLVSFDAFVSTGLAVGGLTITSNGLQLDYDSTNDDFSVSGAASFSLDGSSVSISLAAPGTNTPAGLLIENGQLQNLDATVNGGFTVGDLSLTASNLTFDYQATSPASSPAAGGSYFAMSGGMTFMLGSSTVSITLAAPSTTSLGGLVIEDGSLLSLDATVNGGFTVGDLSLTASNLTFDYQATSPAAGGSYFAMSGGMTFMLGSSMVSISLAAPSSTSLGGLVIEDGSLLSLDATVNGGFTVGDLSLTASNLTFDYQATSPASSPAAGGSYFAMSGGITFMLGSSMVSITLAAPSTTTLGGLVIADGSLLSLDATVNGGFTVGALAFTADNLTFDYQATSPASSPAAGGNYFAMSGGMTFMLGSSMVSITLAAPSATTLGGLVIADGSLLSLDASVTSHFDLLGIDLSSNGLGIDYEGGQTNTFELVGGISLSSSFLNFSATLGSQQPDGEQDQGILIENGKLESLDISVSGGFSLFGFQVEATGLTIQYSSTTSELELSGGIMLDFTSVFEVSAAISQGGLFINTQTGALSIPSTGLQITASAILGPFSIQNLMISFSNGSGGVNFSASGAVDLPGGIDVDLTQLVVTNGQLDDIGL
jgi:uncharacterized membrane protein